MKKISNNNISVLHLDSEKSWRGGQQQASYLHNGLLQKNIKSYFFCKTGSQLAKHFEKEKIIYNTLPFSNEFDFVTSFKISNFARKFNIDVIQCHSAHAHSLGLLSKYFFSKPALISTRRVLFNIQKNFLSVKKYSSSKLDKIVCVSEAIKQVLISDGIQEDKLIVINDGIDLSKFENSNQNLLIQDYSIRPNSIIIGTIAAFTEEKDYPNLLAAAKIVIETNPHCIFIALGSGNEFENMKLLANDYGIKDKFIFSGFKSNVGDYLKLFDIFVLNSKSEGLGTSILDAMALGLPIIATNVGGIPEIVEANVNGLLVESSDYKSLANSINILVNNETLRLQFGNKSLELVRKYGIEIMINKYNNLYNSL